MFNGNAQTATPALFCFINTIDVPLSCFNDWEALEEKDLIPKNIKTKLRRFKTHLEEISEQYDSIDEKLSNIASADQAAQELPLTLDDVKEYNSELKVIRDDIAVLAANISKREKRSSELVQEMKTQAQEANRTAQECAEAARISTSVGLASAFEERAKRLTRSTIAWVIGLAIALSSGSTFAYFRFDKLATLLSQPDISNVVISVNLLIAIVSVGAPVWFAWLSTKQIGQTFRLSEDYSYKASLSKAYEGYRREANRFGVEFEEKLFGSAIEHLDEIPLRLVESKSYGSPGHEFMDSPVGKEFMAFLTSKFPDKDLLADFLRSRKSSKGSKAQKSQTEQEVESNADHTNE